MRKIFNFGMFVSMCIIIDTIIQTNLGVEHTFIKILLISLTILIVLYLETYSNKSVKIKFKRRKRL